jgi:alkylhydroperoxidase family enzyme
VARLPYLSLKDLPEADHDVLRRPIALNRCLANNPGAARAFGGLGSYIRFESSLPPRLRELAILQIGWLARSPYEWSHHIKIGLDFGVSHADIAGLIAQDAGEPNELEPLARLVLQGASEIYRGGMGAETFAALQATLDHRQMVDLTITAAFYCAVVRALATLEIDVEPEYQQYLEQYPLPA